MPTRDEHLAAARRNEAIAERLATLPEDGSMEWAITVLFYAGVRYGRGWGSMRGQGFVTHQAFQDYFLTTTGEGQLLKHYWELRRESERARYLGGNFTLADFEHVRNVHLAPWRAGLFRLMGLPDPGPVSARIE